MSDSLTTLGQRSAYVASVAPRWRLES